MLAVNFAERAGWRNPALNRHGPEPPGYPFLAVGINAIRFFSEVAQFSTPPLCKAQSLSFGTGGEHPCVSRAPESSAVPESFTAVCSSLVGSIILDSFETLRFLTLFSFSHVPLKGIGLTLFCYIHQWFVVRRMFLDQMVRHFTSSGFNFNLTQRRRSFATGSGTGYSPSA